MCCKIEKKEGKFEHFDCVTPKLKESVSVWYVRVTCTNTINLVNE